MLLALPISVETKNLEPKVLHAGNHRACEQLRCLSFDSESVPVREYTRRGRLVTDQEADLPSGFRNWNKLFGLENLAHSRNEPSCKAVYTIWSALGEWNCIADRTPRIFRVLPDGLV